MSITPKILDVALIANLETLGPVFVTETSDEFFPESTQMLLASRVIIITGMADHLTPVNELQGPVPVSELSDDEYSFYFFQIRPKGTRSNLHFIVLICFKRADKHVIRNYEVQIESLLVAYIDRFDFSRLEKGTIENEDEMFYKQIITELATELQDTLEGNTEENSLFDIAYVANLPERLSLVAKQFILAPSGIRESEVGIYKEEIEELVNRGLLHRKSLDGVSWLIPR